MTRTLRFLAFAAIACQPLALPAHAAPEKASAVALDCTTTREYVTTLEFLRDRKELSVPEKDARGVADRVSTGCSGAAKRFIRITSLLSKAGLTGNDAVRAGEELALRTDTETETFAAVFEKAYLSEYLDLDLSSALRMARSLSTEFEGDVQGARVDFERLVDFCAGSKALNLPKPECGAFAARLAREGQRWSGGISEPFIHSFEFMTSGSAGPHLTTRNALALAEDLVRAGPAGPENFIQAYEYGASKKGLALGDAEALRFAKRMAFRSQGG